MKIKFKNLLADIKSPFGTSLLGMLFVLFILSSCSNDDEVTGKIDGTNYAPQLTATIEEGALIRAGVIEDNENYPQGEKFYWTNDDATNVYFIPKEGTGTGEYRQSKYIANVSQGVKSKNCTFNVESSNITADDKGAHTAYGYFPASAWSVGNQATVPAQQIQSDATSTHLGAYMLMRAINDVILDGTSAINLNYKHLVSVFRFAVWNNSATHPDLKLTRIGVSLKSKKPVFGILGHFNNLNAPILTVSNTTSGITLELTDNAQNFSLKDQKSQCEGYMAVMPTATDAFDVGDDLIIELSFTDGNNIHYTTTKTYNVATDLPFLKGGIEQGKSYYFQLKINSENLLRTYAVDD